MDSFAVNLGPLEIGIFAIAVYDIVITTQKFSLVGGHRFFAAEWTFGHRFT